MILPRESRRRPWPRLAASRFATGVLLLVVGPGCGGSKSVCGVSGKVLVDGVPTGGIYVVFRRIGGDAGGPESGVARSDKDGTFSLGVDQPGEMAITVFWPKVTVKGEDTVEEGDLFNNVYRNPGHPVSKAQIHEGENAVPPIELIRPASGNPEAGNRR